MPTCPCRLPRASGAPGASASRVNGVLSSQPCAPLEGATASGALASSYSAPAVVRTPARMRNSWRSLAAVECPPRRALL
eukprot:451621-Pyramimonas_sp.AAC.1